MRLEHAKITDLKKNLLEIIGRHVNLREYRVFFFGSRVNSKGSERSDIDLGIEGEKPIPPKAFFDIEEEIENMKTLYTIDLVDFNKVSPEFKEVAKKKAEYLN